MPLIRRQDVRGFVLRRPVWLVRPLGLKAVQKAAEKEAKGGKIVRWEKEGGNYEAVIEKNGKETGFKFDANGKVLNKHDEANEKGEKH